MTALIRMPRAAWRRQPAGKLEINGRNPLANGLIRVFGISLDGYEAVGKARSAVLQSSNASFTSEGMQFATASYSLGNSIAAGNLSEVYSTDTLSVFSLATPSALTARSSLWSIESAVCVGMGYSSPGMVFSYSGTGYTFESIPGFFGVGLPIKVGFTYDNLLTAGRSSFYKNGSLVLRTNPTASGQLPASGVFYIGGIGSGSVSTWKGVIALTLVWKGALSDSAHAEIAANPYQIFAPRPARLILIPSSGSSEWTLAISNSYHPHNASNAMLSQGHTLSLQTASHLQNSTSPSPSVSITLSPINAEQAQTTGAITLTQTHIIVINNALQQQMPSVMNLLQGYVLSLQNTHHLQLVSTPNLIQSNLLTPNSASQTTSISAVNLIQANILSINTAIQLQTATSLTLASGLVLSLNLSNQSTTSTTPNLTQANVLAVNTSAHSQSMSTPILMQGNVLFIGNGIQSQLADTVTLSQGMFLQLQAATQTQATSSITVSAGLVLHVLNTVHSHNTELLNLSTHITLVVSNALHRLYSLQTGFSTLLTTGSVLVIQAEDRLLLVMEEDRSLSVQG